MVVSFGQLRFKVVRPVQLSKALSPMVVRTGQPLKSKEPVRPVQSEKAKLPMVVSFGQPLKSKVPVRPVQSSKAELPMVIRVEGSCRLTSFW